MINMNAAKTHNSLTIPSKTAVLDIHHDVGGDINDYFIEATYRRDNGSFSSHENQADKIWWEDVEPNNIQVLLGLGQHLMGQNW